MDILGFITIGIPLMLLFCMGIVGCGFLIKEIWGIFKDRKPVLDSNTTVAAMTTQYMDAVEAEFMNYTGDKPKWVTPLVVEESTLEFTGIRAIQL